MSNNPRSRISNKIVHKNPWFVVKDETYIKPDGSKGEYYVVDTQGDSVFVIALTNNNEVYLIKQHRYPTNMYSWEIIGGRSDGEHPLRAARRELREETGLVAGSWKKIGRFQVMNGICNEFGHVYVARKLRQTKFDKKEEEGIIRVVRVPFDKAIKMIKTGKISDGQSINALMLASLKFSEI
ncbi:NUDIX hydrolase [Candidatus Curtissbacteria bacterium]|nr:NUDIX hydrolase [Candidatus Curtissbacteria bacterium]